MELTDLNAEDRRRKETELLGAFMTEDALVACSFLIEDARAARAWVAGAAVSRYSQFPFPGDRSVYDLGNYHYRQLVERLERLPSKTLRDALIAYVMEGANDYLRAPRFRVDARVDAQLVEKLTLGTLTTDVLAQLGLDPPSDDNTDPNNQPNNTEGTNPT